MVYDEVLSLLKRNGVSYTIHEHPPVVSIAEAEVKALHLVPNLLKTVVFKIKDAFWVLAAVRCHDRIDYRGLAEAFQVNRRQVRSLSPREVEQELGFEIGGVGPIPLRDDIKVVFDSGLEGAGKVCFGSGRNTCTIELELKDLLRVTGGRVFPIVRA